MSDIISFLRNYDYDLCLAKGVKWTLEEAIDYLASYLANRQSWSARTEAYNGFLSIKEQLYTTVQHGIDEGRLCIAEVYKDGGDARANTGYFEIDFKKSIVVPLIFINWAIDNSIEVPKQYEKHAAVKKGEVSAYYEGLGVKKSCIHHERCRAVAELLWSVEPDIPIAEMAGKYEIIQFGCEGHPYDMRTISRWLASLKPDRRPGRRKKVEST